MSEIDVHYFADDKGNAPAYQWVKTLHPKVKTKAYSRILHLKEIGHEILENRTEAAYLGDDICELRWQALNQHYRLLFTFLGQSAVLLSHGIVKTTDRVPQREIDTAIEHRELYLSNPEKFTMPMPE